MESVKLEQFIQSNPHPQELKRALAVRMYQQGHNYRQIRDSLAVSLGFISKSRQRYEAEGIEGLRLNYWGTQGYLNAEQKQEIYHWLNEKDSWTLQELQLYVQEKYGVVYSSVQSYYSLFKEGGFSWKKSTPTHPDKDQEQVAEKKRKLRSYWSKIKSRLPEGN